MFFFIKIRNRTELIIILGDINDFAKCT